MASAQVDSHTFIWLVTKPDRLSPTARSCLADPDLRLLLSVASGRESAIKESLGKLRLTVPLQDLLLAAPATAMVEWFPILPAHMIRVASLPRHHGDPFDRLMVAQAWVEGIPIVSADPALDAYGVGRIW
jgi:PIN domain nuclease of toxin-antitoxin system